MLTETSVTDTDDWWLMQLAQDFGADLPRMGRMRSYADGTNALPDETNATMREAYRKFIHMSRLNMADLIVSARTNRMKPLGFRTAAPSDANGDALAMSAWKRSSMKVGVRNFFQDAGIYGAAYLTTTGPQHPSATAEPLIIPSNGWSTITRQYTTKSWLAEAALQIGYDPINGVDLLTLFRPGYMRTAMRSAVKSSIPENGRRWKPGRGWSWVSDPVSLGFTTDVPIFKLSGPGGMGMFEKHTDSLDRITNDIRDRLTINAMQAFRQRAIDGELPEEYPEGHERAGQKINYDEVFRAGPAALWMLPAGAKVWESTTTDTTALLSATEKDTKDLAAVSSTPIYILSPDAASGAAAGADLLKETLKFSTEEWCDRAEIPIAQSISASFLAIGDHVRAAVGEIETIWAPVDAVPIQTRADAASKAKSGGLPQQFIDEKIWQLSPSEIASAQQYRVDDAFLLPAGAPTAS